MELEVTDPQNKQTVSPQNSSIGKLSQQVHVVVNCHGGSLEPSKSSLNWYNIYVTSYNCTYINI